jgi:glycosyltransferase involved in cell wall biosynthesis
MAMEKKEPVISVITPVLNGVQFIDRCVENVVSQRVTGVEHILVDGGSTDGSESRMKAASVKHDHVRLILAPGSNQADSMNKGIAAATGRVLATLNVDDFYTAGTLNEVAALFKSLEEPAFVVGNCRLLAVGDRIIYTSRPRDLQIGKLALCGLRKHCFPLNPSSYFYHRSLHATVGTYDVDLDFTLDVDFVLRAIPAAKVRYVNRDWGNFRLLPGTKTYRDYITTFNGPTRVRPVVMKHLRRLPIRERIRAELVYQVHFGGFKLWLWCQGLRMRSFRKRHCSRN